MSTFSKLCEAMTRQRRLWEEELRRLSENPELAGYAQALMDRLWSDLDYLCHFDKAIDGRGKSHPMGDVQEHLKDMFSETYLRLTGKEYRPKICRAIEDLERSANDAEGNKTS